LNQRLFEAQVLPSSNLIASNLHVFLNNPSAQMPSFVRQFGILLPYDSPGMYGTFCNISASSWFTNAQNPGLRLADFDGDGFQDLMCWNATSGQVSVLPGVGLNKGLFDFSAAAQSTLFSSWCVNGFNLLVGDFNGDGKSDILCSGSDNKIYLKFSNSITGTGMQGLSFYPASGYWNGTIAYTWPSGATKHGIADLLMVSDIDGDGADDLIITANNYNYFYNFKGSSIVQITSPIYWCGSNLAGTYMLSGDFNGDGKGDLFCLSQSNTIYVLFSNVQPTNYITQLNSPSVKVTIKDFALNDVYVDSKYIKESINQVTCNNVVRPDEELKCIASTSINIQKINSITGLDSWIRDGLSSIVSIKLQMHDHFLINVTDDQGLFSSNQKDIKITGSYDSSSAEILSIFAMSVSTNVKSGDCVVYTTTTKYLHSVQIPFTATAHLQVYSGNAPFQNTQLLSYAKQSGASDMILNPLDSSEVLFPIVGVIDANFMFNNNATAENCF